MAGLDDSVEKLGPQARLRAELRRLEARDWEIWLLVAFAAAVLVLGILSLLIPRGLFGRPLVLTIPPPVLFVVMVVIVVLALFLARREIEVKKLRLANLEHVFSAREEHSAGLVDALTNVFSRGILRELLQSEIARAERNSRPLTLLMCDLDGFKQVNDRYGHLTGDLVLAEIGGVIKSCARGSDHVVRYGGDEFLLILPETDRQGGETVRDRIRQKLAEWDATNRFGKIPISMSAGLHVHVTGEPPEKAVAEADIRMYAEKVERRRKEFMANRSSPEKS